MKFVADLHLHSKYSRAVSQEMILEKMAQWAKYKGIQVLATGDFTHPFWFEKLKSELVDAGNGLYRLKPEITNSKSQNPNKQETYFLLSCEISSIYSQGGKGRRIHNLFFFPSLASVEKFNAQLIKRGANLRSDGRPIVGISSRDLAQIALDVDEKALIIPAHAWTPWFSIFGSFSGFDSIEECFGDMAENIYGIETGLSSDPAMNWQIKDLENRSILSFSDAHSLPKMGREATVFEAKEVSYDCIYDAIKKVTNESNEPKVKSTSDSSGSTVTSVTSPRVAFTIEFYPEEGKYHFTGHRDCGYSQGSERAKEKMCPVCKRPLTVGVMDRVEQLKTLNSKSETRNIDAMRWIYPKNANRAPYVSLVPLVEILSESVGESRVGVASKVVIDSYMRLVDFFGSEFNVLLKAKLDDLSKVTLPKVVDAIEKVRVGDIEIVPGYDGQFGVVQIWKDTKTVSDSEDSIKENTKDESNQLNLFVG